MRQREDGAPPSATRSRTLAALVWQARSIAVAQGQQPALGVALGRRAPSVEAVNQVYLDIARLLTRVAPLVLVDDTFALKGGTAINLFVRNMPRLLVVSGQQRCDL